jgi:hypothetical protein
MVVTYGPWYPGYKTPAISPKPSIERVAGAVHSTGGRICTHMSLWVPPQDSMASKFHMYYFDFS